ncbi:MAG: hypothetical protein E6R03_02855 [Hyphomicrobiaceae bacterium]|nr:MAG: hypothetical protein E6R03_02855 [Hyphomicrobiaceae bacterium]
MTNQTMEQRVKSKKRAALNRALSSTKRFRRKADEMINMINNLKAANDATEAKLDKLMRKHFPQPTVVATPKGKKAA